MLTQDRYNTAAVMEVSSGLGGLPPPQIATGRQDYSAPLLDSESRSGAWSGAETPLNRRCA